MIQIHSVSGTGKIHVKRCIVVSQGILDVLFYPFSIVSKKLKKKIV